MKLNGTMLVDARHKKGLNQDEVADACGLSRITIFNAEKGKDVYPATGKRIIDFLGLNPEEVVLPVERTGDGDAA